jgi:SnoaL-like domain
MTMDWDAWARRAEAAIDMSSGGDWKGLFAPGAVFADPNTPAGTGELREISRDTRAIFPDWHQEITSIRGGDTWGWFVWVGRATYEGKIPVVMHGATVVEVDGDGLVTSWRDYLDRKEPEDQIRAWYKEHGR